MAEASEPPRAPSVLAHASPRAGEGAEDEHAANADVIALAGGAHAIIRPSRLSNAVTVKTAVPGIYSCDLCTADAPAPGYTSIGENGLANELSAIVARVQANLAAAKPALLAAPSSNDPAARLEEIFSLGFARDATPPKAAPLLVIVAGDVDSEAAALLVESAFGAMSAARPAVSLAPSTGDVISPIPKKKAQTALGYMVEAPAANSPDAIAWRLALYILSHEYGGRLGAEAISRQGLVYYIGADYRPAGDKSLITLSTGVDPEKQEAMTALLKSELDRLAAEPPTAEELAAAKRHLIGRRLSAAQSADEIADALARDWLAFGELRSDEDFTKSVEAVTLEDLAAVLPAFAKGDIVTVRVGAKEQSP
jgi:hypothetical protein